jgi:hypothetical protein
VGEGVDDAVESLSAADHGWQAQVDLDHLGCGESFLADKEKGGANLP